MTKTRTTKTIKVYTLIKKQKKITQLHSSVDKMLSNTINNMNVKDAERYIKDANELKQILNTIASLAQDFGA